jgi:hypothetical protein
MEFPREHFSVAFISTEASQQLPIRSGHSPISSTRKQPFTSNEMMRRNSVCCLIPHTWYNKKNVCFTPAPRAQKQVRLLASQWPFPATPKWGEQNEYYYNPITHSLINCISPIQTFTIVILLHFFRAVFYKLSNSIANRICQHEFYLPTLLSTNNYFTATTRPCHCCMGSLL